MDYSKETKRADVNAAYLGIPPKILMENAGRALANACVNHDPVIVCCGRGNNGGDGLVCARHLSSMGKRVRVYVLAGERSRENKRNLEILERLDSIDLVYLRDSRDCAGIGTECEGFDVLIDALLGVGVRGDPVEPVKTLVDCMNSLNLYKISADVPTPGFRPDLTISFHKAKTETAQVVNIGIPLEADLYCGPGDVCVSLPRRTGPEHKGDFGRVLVIGGSRDYIGAPYLCARAALNTGTDLVSLACTQYVADHSPRDPEIIYVPLDSEDYLAKSDVKKMLDLNFDSMVVGNGISLREETKYFVRELLKKVRKPVVIDADALKLLDPSGLGDNHILTPHLKEYSGLFGEPGESLDDKAASVEKCAKRSGSTILLKGPVDIISNGKETRFNKTGNPYMTVGGTGDVLAGVAGVFSTFTNVFDAACCAAFLTGLAGDLCLEDTGYPLTAMDVVSMISGSIGYCLDFQK